MGELAAVEEGIFVLDGENLIVDFGIQRFRHEAGADALDFVRARRSLGENGRGGRFDSDDLYRRILRLEVFTGA